MGTIQTVLTYDIAGNVKSVTDQNGHATTLQYSDSNGTYAHPTQQTNALGQSALSLAKTIHLNKKIYNASEVEKRVVALLVAAGAKQ